MGTVGKILSVKKYGYMLKQLVGRDFKVRYRGSLLGVLWSVLNPLLYMLVLSVVFSRVFKQVDNYRMYLLSGLVIFNFFNEAANVSVMAVVSNFGLITKVYFPKFILPLSKVLSSAINLAFSVVAFFVLGAFMGIRLWWGFVLIPYVLACLLVFTVGVAFLLSCLQVFMRDVQHLFTVIITLWMYATPILYPIDIIPKEYWPVFRLNPLYCFVDFLRSITLAQSLPSLYSTVMSLAWAVGMFVFGAVVFIKNQGKFIYYT